MGGSQRRELTPASPECHNRVHRLRFLYPNRVPFQEAFAAIEPDDGKQSRPVLRGPGLNNGVRLLDP